jgi:O-antigen/teichoic acid export membrane protein
MMSFKEFASRLVSVPYKLIFKERIGGDAAKLLTDTSYVATGVVFGSLLTFVFYILGARILGPSNFGNLSLISSIGGIFTVLMGLIVYPMIKYAAGARDESEQIRIISTSYVQTTLIGAASVAICLLISGPLSQLFGIPIEQYLFAVAYAVTITFFGLTVNTFRIFFKMKAYGLLNAVQSAVVLLVFLVLISNNMRSWESAAAALYISYAAVGLVSIAYLRKYITLRFDRFWSRKIMTYVRFAIPGAIAGACMGVDRILINVFRSTAEVGIYNAYFLASITVALTFWLVLNASFFPYASKSNDRRAIFVKITKAAPYVAMSLVPLFILVEWIAFFLYGRQYPFSWEIALFFALAATSNFFSQCYTWLMAAEGTRGAKVGTRGNIMIFVVLIGLDVILIPLFGILGAIITFTFANLVAVFYFISQRQILGGGAVEVSPSF